MRSLPLPTSHQASIIHPKTVSMSIILSLAEMYPLWLRFKAWSSLSELDAWPHLELTSRWGPVYQIFQDCSTTVRSWRPNHRSIAAKRSDAVLVSTVRGETPAFTNTLKDSIAWQARSTANGSGSSWASFHNSNNNPITPTESNQAYKRLILQWRYTVSRNSECTIRSNGNGKCVLWDLAPCFPWSRESLEHRYRDRNCLSNQHYLCRTTS